MTLSQRIVRRAAQILEREAQALKESHTVGGLWGTDTCDKHAQHDHDEMIRIAKQLRHLTGER